MAAATRTSASRVWQVATVQFDFVQPERFGLEYTDEKGAAQRPIMIHCAIMGSFDRFFSVYIEHTAGRFPIWLAPEQIRVLTVNQDEAIVKFASEMVEKGMDMGLRIKLDNSSQSVGRKIRDAEVWKVPYAIVVGEKEVQSGQLSPRVRKDIAVQPPSTIGVENFLKTVSNESHSRVSKSSL